MSMADDFAGLEYTAPGTAGAPATGRASRQDVVKFWAGKGVPEHVAEGIADRVGVESGFNPTVPGDGGTSVGLYQHHADRMSRLQKMENWQSPQTQNEFAYSEVTGGDKIAASHWDEIKSAPDRKTAERLWTKYFERPAKSTMADKFMIAPESVSHAQGIPGSAVYENNIYDLLSMLPEPASDKAGRSKNRSLLESVLGRSEPIMDLPHIDVTYEPKTGRAKIVDYDGLHRLSLLAQQGVNVAPVSIRGLPEGAQIKEIEDMRGTVRPFDFQPVPKIVTKPPSEGGFERYLSASAQGIGQMAREVPRALGDIGRAAVGTAEMATQGFNNMIGLGALNAPDRQPIQPGIERLSDLATFATGGLTGPIAPEVQALRQATAMPAAAAFATEPRAPIATGGGMANPQVENFLRDVRAYNTTENRAREAINQRFAQSQAGGGSLTPGIAASELGQGRAAGQPMTLADLRDENMRGLLGNVAREPGPARNRVSEWAVGRLADVDRDAPGSTRLERAIGDLLGTGSARTEAKRLIEQRAAGKPLWDEAMRGGSIAPLETQFQNEFNALSRTVSEGERDIARIEGELTGGLARQSQAGNVYSASAANRARRFAEDKVAERRQAVAAARNAKERALERLRQAQADGTAKAPGAVWSPYLDRLRDNPKVRGGINRGMTIERDLADAERRPFNPREYAVIGYEANGDPVVGAVPNMRLWATAKEGLDAMLESPEFRTEFGTLTKPGRAVLKLRNSLLDELDRLNPRYKPARDKWAGDTALMNSLRDGKTFHRSSPEEIAEFFAESSESEKEFYRVGMADTLREDLDKVRLGGDPSKAIVNSPGARKRLLPAFRDQRAADDFVGFVKRERQMFSTPVEVLGNSKTAARAAEDRARQLGLDDVVDTLHGVASAAMGHPSGAISSLVRGARRYMSPPDNALNDAIARLMLDPSLQVESAGQNLLRRLPLPRVQNALARGAMNWSRQFSSPTLP